MAEIFDFLVKGGVLMVPIALSSIIALGIFLERLWALQRQKVVPAPFMSHVARLLSQHKHSEAETLASSNESSVSIVLQAGLRHRGRRREVIKESFEESGRHEVAELERHVPALGTIASIAPLLGLLGTVQGMIVAFQRVVYEVADASTVDPGHLAAGIWTALITTAAGLAVAIPTFIGYKYLLSRIDRYALEMEEFSLQLVELLEAPEQRAFAAPQATGAAAAEQDERLAAAEDGAAGGDGERPREDGEQAAAGAGRSERREATR